VNKYGNTRIDADGITFDSKAEYARYQELVLLERAGEISKLRVHVKYPIIVNGKLVCNYIADFTYFEGGREKVEDVKGVRTAAYRIKAKLMQASLGITIQEVTA